MTVTSTPQATFAVTVIQTSSAQGEQSQIDMGPFVTANVNVSAGMTSASSPAQLVLSNLAAGWTNISLNWSNTNANAAPFPMYLGINPLPATSGTVILGGANTDTGVQISSTNPSFIPALTASFGEESPLYSPPVVWVDLSQATPLEVQWF